MSNIRYALIAGLIAVALVSCGGGSGGSGKVVSTLSFPLRDAMKTNVVLGTNVTYDLSGYCSGTMVISDQPPAAATFEGISGFSAVTGNAYQFSNCTPSTYNINRTDYYDNNYDALGTIVAGGDYSVSPIPISLPVSVKVGDTAAIGTMNDYSDSSKTVSTGHDEYSYIIEPDTADTAIVDLVGKFYDASSNLVETDHTRYRIYASGDMVPVSGDILSGNVHFVLTPRPDTSPPAVAASKPANNSYIKSSGGVITATFSKPMDASTLSGATFIVTGNSSGTIQGTVTYAGRVATFIPATQLPDEVLTARITRAVKDLAGNPMANDYSWTFTIDNTPPVVASSIPVDLSVGVSVFTSVSASFTEALDPAAVTATSFTLTDGSNPVDGTVSISGTTATFHPATPLSYGKNYTVTLTADVKDLAGNPLASAYSWSFTTRDAPAMPQSNQSVAYQSNHVHSGYVTFGTPLAFPTSAAWSVTLSDTASYPLIAGGKVFVMTDGISSGNGTRLYAIDELTGNTVWGPVDISGTNYAGFTYDNGTIFVVSYDGMLQSIDAATGNANWSTQLLNPGWFDSQPTASNGIVYIGDPGQLSKLYAVDETNGSVLWSSTVANDHSSPAVTSDGVFVTSPCQASKLDPFTGATLWRYYGGCVGGGGRTPVYANGLLYTRDTDPGLILNAASGVQTGTFSTAATMPIPAFTTQTGYFLNAGTLKGTDLASGNVLWNFKGDGGLVSAPVVIDQTVFIGSSSGNVYALDAVTGAKLWKVNAGGAIARPDEINIRLLTGLGAGEGYLVVPAGNVLTAWRLVP